MPDLKRSLRLLKTLTALRGARFHTVAQLARRFGISERTVFRDLADLGRDWPLESNPEGSGYRLPPGTELPPVALAVEEIALLRALLGQPLVERDGELRRTARSLATKLAAAVAAFDETPAGLELATLDRSGPKAERAHAGLRKAIEKTRAVEIVYESLSGREQRPRPRGLDPWQVFHRGDAWYVVGFCRVHHEPRVFRLDRISRVTELPERARRPEDLAAELSEPTRRPEDLAAKLTRAPRPRPAAHAGDAAEIAEVAEPAEIESSGASGGARDPLPAFDLDAFLADSWNVFTGRQRHEVVVEFAAAVAPLVANARHHAGERQRKLPGGAIEYRVTLASLEEIARWLLGFGGTAKVLDPPELRTRLQSLARAALEANTPVATHPKRRLTDYPRLQPRR